MPGKLHWVEDLDAIAALKSAVRQRILDHLEAEGPCAVATVAEALGRPPDRIYYHLRVLERVGLVELVGTEGEGRGSSARYDLAHRRWHLAYEPGDPTRVAAINDLTAAMLREAKRDFEAGWRGRGLRVRGRLRNLWSLRLEARLSAEEQRTLTAHLEAIVALMRGAREAPADGARTHVALTWVMAPIEDERGPEDR